MARRRRLWAALPCLGSPWDCCERGRECRAPSSAAVERPPIRSEAESLTRSRIMDLPSTDGTGRLSFLSSRAAQAKQLTWNWKSIYTPEYMGVEAEGRGGLW